MSLSSTPKITSRLLENGTIVLSDGSVVELDSIKSPHVLQVPLDPTRHKGVPTKYRLPPAPTERADVTDELGNYVPHAGALIGLHYRVVAVIGRGAYGVVLRCVDMRKLHLADREAHVAIKVFKCFQKYQRRAEREAAVLRYVKRKAHAHVERLRETSNPNQQTSNEDDKCDEDFPNVVTLLDSFSFFGHRCLVFPLLGPSLYQLTNYNHYRGLPLCVVRNLTLRLGMTLDFLASDHGSDGRPVVHGNVRPENICLVPRRDSERMRRRNVQVVQRLLRGRLPPVQLEEVPPFCGTENTAYYNELFDMPVSRRVEDHMRRQLFGFGEADLRNMDVVLIGFGSATPADQLHLLPPAQSRYYRAPEVLLGNRSGLPVDTWALGCVAAELATGRAVFAAVSEREQCVMIKERIGFPDPQLWALSPRADTFVDCFLSPALVSHAKDLGFLGASSRIDEDNQLECFLDRLVACSDAIPGCTETD
ncbi:MAG: hypothetical protein MHM6MM_007528, partial [Cercozoa sp. M6MM]